MFEDNRALAKLVSHQNERLAFVAAGEPERGVMFEQARRELAAVTAERDELKTQLAALHALHARPDVVAFQKTAADLELTRTQLRSALAEVSRLQGMNKPFTMREYSVSVHPLRG
jgi:hypothetical protein